MIYRLMVLVKLLALVLALSLPFWLEGRLDISAYGLRVQMGLGVALLGLFLLLWILGLFASGRRMIGRGVGFFARRKRMKSERLVQESLLSYLKEMAAYRPQAALRYAEKLSRIDDHPLVGVVGKLAMAVALVRANKEKDARNLWMQMQQPSTSGLSHYVGAAGVVWQNRQIGYQKADWYQIRRDAEHLLSLHANDSAAVAAMVMADLSLGELQSAHDLVRRAGKANIVSQAVFGRFVASVALASAMAKWQKGERSSALAACEEGLKHAPYHPALVAVKYDYLMQIKDYAKLAKWLPKIWKILPYRPWVDAISARMDAKPMRLLKGKLVNIVPDHQWLDASESHPEQWVCAACHVPHDDAKLYCPSCFTVGAVVPKGLEGRILGVNGGSLS